MPTYEYECEACGHRFEKFQSITARPIRRCPRCDRQKVRRLIGGGAGILFKGSGFYQTDYRSESYRKAAEKDKSAGSKESTSAEKSGDGKKPGASTTKADPTSSKTTEGE